MEFEKVHRTEGATATKWVVIRFDQAGIEGWDVLEIATDDVDEANQAADAWEERNFNTVGCTKVLTIDEVKDLAEICREVLASLRG